MQNLLEPVAARYGTDKQQKIHDYTRTYDRHLSPIKDNVKSVLELGIYEGASLLMWADYFINAQVHGVDIDRIPERFSGKYRDPRITCHKGGQCAKPLTDRIAAACGGTIDVVIDDASHKDADQKKSFQNIWPNVTDGGFYIVEDTCCNYWEQFGNGWPTKRHAAINFFRSLVHDVNLRGHRLQIDNGVPLGSRQAKRLIDDIQDRGSHKGMYTDIEEIIFSNSAVLLRKRGQL